MAVWNPARQGTVAVCEQCEILVRDPYCDLWSYKGRLIYVWRRVGLSDNGRVIWRGEKEGRNSYRGVWYMFYVKLSV